MGFILKPFSPSFSSGFARSQALAQTPDRWGGLIGAWFPTLGDEDTALSDISLNNAHGTNTDIAYGNTGGPFDIGGYLTYDGATSKTEMNGRIASAGSASYVMWIRPEAAAMSVSDRFISQAGNDTGDFSIRINDAAGHLVFSRWTGTGNNLKSFTSSTTVLVKDEWNHFAICYDDNSPDEATFYLNGIAETVSSASSTSTLSPANFKLGNFEGAFFEGSIGDTLAYNRCLAAEEVLDLFTNPFSITEPKSQQMVVFVVPHAGGDRLVSYPSGDPLFSDPSGDPLRSFRVDPVIASGALTVSANLAGLVKQKSTVITSGSLITASVDLTGSVVRTGSVTGSIVVPSPTLSNSERTSVNGALEMPSPTLSGQANKIVGASGALEVSTGVNSDLNKVAPSSGALSVPAPALNGVATLNRLRQASGALEVSSALTGSAEEVILNVQTAAGDLSISGFLLSGESQKLELHIGTGALSIPSPILSGDVKKLAAAGGEVIISDHILAGLVVLARQTSAVLTVAPPLLSGAAKKETPSSGSFTVSASLGGTVTQIGAIPSAGTLSASVTIQGQALKVVVAEGDLEFGASLGATAKKEAQAAGSLSIESALYGGAQNASTGEKQAYRVESIEHIPGNPTKKVMLEPIRSPLV